MSAIIPSPFRSYIMAGIPILLIGTHLFAYSKGVHVERNRWKIVQAQEAVDRSAEEAKNRTEEARRFTKIQEIADEAVKERDQARADAGAASAAGVRLRAKISDLTMRIASRDSSPVESGETAGETVDLLGIVQQRLDDAADGIARYADEASAAGRACERSYDALRNR